MRRDAQVHRTTIPENLVRRAPLVGLTILLLCAGPRQLAAQQADAADRGPLATIQQLFTAMGAGDSAAARRTFVPFARVLPMRAASPAPMTVDQFAAFVATIAPGSWNERLWDPRSEVFESLAQLWFEYDVVRSDTVRQCGRQSVQLARTSDGWRITSMALMTSAAPCPRAPR